MVLVVAVLQMAYRLQIQGLEGQEIHHLHLQDRQVLTTLIKVVTGALVQLERLITAVAGAGAQTELELMQPALLEEMAAPQRQILLLDRPLLMLVAVVAALIMVEPVAWVAAHQLRLTKAVVVMVALAAVLQVQQALKILEVVEVPVALLQGQAQTAAKAAPALSS